MIIVLPYLAANHINTKQNTDNTPRYFRILENDNIYFHLTFIVDLFPKKETIEPNPSRSGGEMVLMSLIQNQIVIRNNSEKFRL